MKRTTSAHVRKTLSLDVPLYFEVKTWCVMHSTTFSSLVNHLLKEFKKQHSDEIPMRRKK